MIRTLLTLMVACLLAGCGTRTANVASDRDAGADRSACELKPAGASCASDAECCAALCDPLGGCAAPLACDEGGALCATGATCCSGRCGGDATGRFTCQPGSGACVPNGQPCQVAADCCSLGCNGGVCGAALCNSAGEACSIDADCCANACASGFCMAGGACLPAGEDCSASGSNSCCTRLCVHFGGGELRCAAGGVCRVEGEVCTQNVDCCNVTCTSGRCAVLAECAVVGEACSASEECCSRACADDGTGFKSCQYLGGCRPSGELCRTDTECCNDAADPMPGTCKIFNADEVIGTCGNPGGCAPAGEICEAGANECCSGLELCLPTPIGIRRCFESRDCLADGQPCAFGSQCCAGICASDTTTGALACTPMCIVSGGACTAHADCCEGYCDPGTLRCGVPPGCVPVGGACSSPTECCNHFCEDGICAVVIP